MQLPSRNFQFQKAVRERTPLIIGMAGQSGTGKTYSALRLATGMVKAFGGRIAVVDTEARRALHYADRFDFDHVDFEPPFGPLDYMVAIQTAVDRGATVVIVDSMTHEHSGVGGVMDQIDAFLDDKCGNDWGKREKMNMVAHARIKPQRKALNNYIVQVGRSGVVLILCYRANDKTKPVAPKDRVNGEAMKHVGFTPETTSPLVYEMTQCFLLKPGADGQPTTKPDTDEEKILSKTPIQFKGWSTGQQIDEALGEKLARWAAGGAGATTFGVVSAPDKTFREWLATQLTGYEGIAKPEEVVKALSQAAVDAKLIPWPANGNRTLGWARGEMEALWRTPRGPEWCGREFQRYASAQRAPTPKPENASQDYLEADPDHPDDAREPGE